MQWFKYDDPRVGSRVQRILNVPAEHMDEALGQVLRACLDAGHTLFEIVRE